MNAKMIGSIVLMLSAGAAAQAGHFAVKSWDLGEVEDGAPGYFGDNIAVSAGVFFQSSVQAANDRGPDMGGARNRNREFDSYAGFDGGTLSSQDAEGNPTGPFSGPSQPESTTDALDGYSTNTGFVSVVAVGFTRRHFSADQTRFGGVGFEVGGRSSSSALFDTAVESFFIGRLSVSRGATLAGGVMRVLLANEPFAGGVLAFLPLNGPAVGEGLENNSHDPVVFEQFTYRLVALLAASPDGLGNQAGGAGPFGDADTYDIYVTGTPIPGPIGTGALAVFGACAAFRRRRS